MHARQLMYSNQQAIEYQNIRLADGSFVRLTIDPGNALIASDGVVRSFSVLFPDGSVRNYVFDHWDVQPHVRNEEMYKMLAKAGLTMLQGKIVSVEGMSVPDRFVWWVTRRKISDVAVNWLSTRVHEIRADVRYGYFDLADGTLVMEGTLGINPRTTHLLALPSH
ncbi:hypothetical protein [Streptomyces sp. enrichment culture]|uniref:hypothetical protein n=1 Tax=Streptomyces sp. enrichment culture TaxID=1795815 RepID=UPI003F55D219